MSFRRAAKIGGETLDAAVMPIAHAAAPAAGGLVVVNPAGWSRTDAVHVASTQFSNVKAHQQLPQVRVTAKRSINE